MCKVKRFHEYTVFNDLFRDRRPTSGVLMIANAIAMGYKAIYLAGIDLYLGKEEYAFDHKSSDLLRSKYPGFSGDRTRTHNHSEQTDLDALQFLMKTYDEVKIYSICPTSPITEYIELSPVQNMRDFVVENKPQGYINDMQRPSDLAYYKYNSIFSSLFPKEPENIVLKLYNDFKDVLRRCKRKLFN